MKRILAVLVACAALAGTIDRAAAQATGGPWLGVHGGGYFHASDVHTYHHLRFEDAALLGASLALWPTERFGVRVVGEWVRTSLEARSPAAMVVEKGDDDLVTLRLDGLVGIAGSGARVRPYVGGGVGVRWWNVEDEVAFDDIIMVPFGNQQQFSGSAVAGVSVFTAGLQASLELRAALTRFRVAGDDWGLPGSPVAWQREWQPTLQLAIPIGR